MVQVVICRSCNSDRSWYGLGDDWRESRFFFPTVQSGQMGATRKFAYRAVIVSATPDRLSKPCAGAFGWAGTGDQVRLPHLCFPPAGLAGVDGALQLLVNTLPNLPPLAHDTLRKHSRAQTANRVYSFNTLSILQILHFYLQTHPHHHPSLSRDLAFGDKLPGLESCPDQFCAATTFCPPPPRTTLALRCLIYSRTIRMVYDGDRRYRATSGTV